MSLGKTIAIAATVIVIGGAGLGLYSLRGQGVPNPQYTIVEDLGKKLTTVGFGYQYNVLDNEGKVIYTIEPNYKEKLKKIGMADSFFLKDNNNKIVSSVDGNILTISARHRVYDANGNLENLIARKFGGSFFGRIGRMIFKKDGYFLKDKNEKNIIEIEETWASALSPWLRKYNIIDSESKEQIGTIANNFKLFASSMGAQTYEIAIDNKSPKYAEYLAILMRIIDNMEDKEDSESSKSSSDDD